MTVALIRLPTPELECGYGPFSAAMRELEPYQARFQQFPFAS